MVKINKFLVVFVGLLECFIYELYFLKNAGTLSINDLVASEGRCNTPCESGFENLILKYTSCGQPHQQNCKIGSSIYSFKNETP